MGRGALLEMVLDCSDPQTLMGFWREALSYNQNLWMHHLTEGATYLPL